MAMLCCLNPRASILSSHLLAGSEMLELAGAGPLTVAHTDTLRGQLYYENNRGTSTGKK